MQLSGEMAAWRRTGNSLLDSIEEVDERKMLVKLMSIVDNASHLLHETVEVVNSSIRSRLLQHSTTV